MSMRRSGRGRKGNRGAILIVGALGLIGLVVGIVMVVKPGQKTDPVDEEVASVLPNTRPTENGKPVDAPVVSPSQVGKFAADARATLALPQGDAREKSLRDNYASLCTLLEGPLPAEERDKLIEPFNLITNELFMNSAHNEFSVNYVVKGGDTIDVIARRSGISNNLLTDLNNMPRGTAMLRIGDNLKLPAGKPHVEVRKQDYCCSVYFGEKLVRQYLIAHGKNNNTPEGTTTIKDMQVDPDAQARGPHDTRAEMKLRWLGLTPYNGRTGIGFHGTKEPGSIPGQSSLGCIRMRDKDVVELYDIVRIGDTVVIKA